ncbi:hypothetical protein [Zavarzinella formosa]|uniref:hypothetical protein n=1 Tax=Zavarzinella formosa TaxID=360055 RepID=UPI0002EB238F|nr:hypothetical protein [Zavarzinella formosa]
MTKLRSRRRDEASRRARKVLGWLAVGFLLGQASLFAVLESIRPDLRDPEYGIRLYQLRDRLGERSKSGPLVITLGSSRTGMGIRPDAMGDLPDGAVVFNYGINSGGPLIELLCLRRILAEGITPDLVVAEISPVSLRLDGEDAIRTDRAYYLRRTGLADVDAVSRQAGRPDFFLGEWTWDQLTLSYSQRSFLLAIEARRWLPRDSKIDVRWRGVDPHGFQRLPNFEHHDAVRYQAILAASEKSVAKHYSEFHVSPTAEACLRELLETCRDQNIRVVLVLMPESPSLRSWATTTVHDRVNGLLDGFKRDYHASVVDSRDWITEDGFGDTEHMTVEGAGRFSQRFARDVLTPLLQNPAGK